MSVRDSGFVSQRRILSGLDDISDDLRDQRSSIPQPHFPIVVVEDIIYDPVKLTKEEKDKIRDSVVNPELADRMPRNSIIGNVISREINKSNNTLQIFFPCNPFDVSPLKPGEQAFVFFPDPYRSTQIGYWLCRVPEPLDTEDPNFTHPDRKFEYNDNLTTAEKASGELPPPPGFLNGGETEDSWTTSNKDDYDRIAKEAKANSVIVKEPVARFTKRPGDKVIMGSNGARIVLGLDRSGAASAVPLPNSPTIDIVVNSHEGLSPGVEPIGNSPRAILNARNQIEIDKNPQKSKKNDNAAEGDPDFSTDKARLYITAKSNIDQNFQVNVGTPSGVGPGIALKSDHVRLIANKSIKIVVGSSSIVINANGTIVIDPGTVIKLGGESANLAVARETDPVMSTPNMITWMATVSSMLSTLGGAVGLPPVIPPSDFGKIQKGGNSTKAS